MAQSAVDESLEISVPLLLKVSEVVETGVVVPSASPSVAGWFEGSCCAVFPFTAFL